MEPSRLALALLLLSVALTYAPLAVPSTDAVLEHQRHEVARLRAHFDSVDTELRLRDTPRLTPAQQANRVTLIGWLREYRDTGEFPRNDRFPEALPFFRDSRGVLCAMAYLIERSGRRDIVNLVARTRNNASIPELAGDPALGNWLDSVGLSLAEAARIQPYYGPPPPPVVPDDEAVTAEYAITSLLVSGTALTTIGLNLATPSRSTGWGGVFAGGAGIIAGVANLDGTGGTDKVAAANMIVGGAALALGLHRLLRPPPAQGVSAHSKASLAVSPVVTAASRQPRLGFAVHASF